MFEFLGGVGDIGVGLFELVQGPHELEEAAQVHAVVAFEEDKAVGRVLGEAAGDELAGEQRCLGPGFLVLFDEELSFDVGQATGGPDAADELVEEGFGQGGIGLELLIQLGFDDLEGGGAFAGQQG